MAICFAKNARAWTSLGKQLPPLAYAGIHVQGCQRVCAQRLSVRFLVRVTFSQICAISLIREIRAAMNVLAAYLVISEERVSIK